MFQVSVHPVNHSLHRRVGFLRSLGKSELGKADVSIQLYSYINMSRASPAFLGAYI